ncbi:MAG: zinc ribbon domain-containing protein [Halarchaeum sp.]
MSDRPGPSSDDEYGCPKCGHDQVTTGSISTTGSGLSKMFDVQTNKFETVTCASCGYTELYKDVGNRGSDLADVFFG